MKVKVQITPFFLYFVMKCRDWSQSRPRHRAATACDCPWIWPTRTNQVELRGNFSLVNVYRKMTLPQTIRSFSNSEVFRDDVCFILDLAGFFIYWDVSSPGIGLLHLERKTRVPCFRHPHTIEELKWLRHQQTNCEFCETKDIWINISIRTRQNTPNSSLRWTVQGFIRNLQRMSQWREGYKRGHVEKDLFTKLNIQFLVSI